MKLTYKKDHLSIENFNEIKLADFTVLTGLNGSGKTQLLNAIKNQSILVDSNYDPLSAPNIILLDRSSFTIPQQSLYDNSKWYSDREAQFKNLLNKRVTPVITGQSLQNNDLSNLKTYSMKIDKKIFNLQEVDILKAIGDKKYHLYEKYQNDEIQKAISFGLDKNKFIEKSVTLDDIKDRSLFDELYIGLPSDNSLFINNLSKTFLDYFKLYEKNLFNMLKQEKALPFTGEALSEENFFKRYGKKPWNIINSLLKGLSSKGITLSSYLIDEPTSEDSYTATLKNQEGREITFDKLSSGEQVLISLIISVYKSTIDGNKFPEIILLDEIDASLHPSMCQYLLDTINDPFISNDSKVILATHSPTTVALAPDESIYVMKPNRENRVQKVSKTEAIKELSHGFISIASEEANHNISYNIGKSEKGYILLTEGITDKIILEKAWEKLYNGDDMPFDIQDCFCASVLGNLIKRDEIYNNYRSKTFIALFDYDTAGYTEQWQKLRASNWDEQQLDDSSCKFKKHQTKKGFAILLPTKENEELISENNNRLTNSGICIESLLYSDKTSSHFNQDKKFIGCKKTFSEKVIDNLDQNDFSLFKEIFDTISQIIKS